MKNEKTFNKYFNAFILIGMTVAVVLATVMKSTGMSGTANTLIIISAIGALMGVLSSVSTANGWIITFLFGLIDVTIYGIMCFVNWKNGNSGLGNAILHMVYFVPMQFVGFFQWKKLKDGKQKKLKARRLDLKGWSLVSAFFLAGSVVAYFFLAKFDKSNADTFIKTAVILDVLPLMCNIVGQFLMSTAYMEQWIFWIGVNISSILMWLFTLRNSPDSFALIYVIKYSFYLINSLNGLRIWFALSRKNAFAIEE